MPCPERNSVVIEEFVTVSPDVKTETRNGMLILEPEVMCLMNDRTGTLNITDRTISIHWFADRKNLVVRKYELKS